MTLLFTQSYRDSGFEKLIPIGIASMCYSETGKRGVIKHIREELEKQGIQFVFNCQFEFWFSGHPNNGNYGGHMIGDAYKLPKDFKNIINNNDDDAIVNSKGVHKIKTKKEYQLRCGLITLESEQVE